MIYVCSLSRLYETVDRTGARHVVTLIGSDTAVERPAMVHLDDHLRLSIDDIVMPMEGRVPCAPQHVESLVAFGRRWDRTQPLVVHCWAGISRSSAAAYVLACALMPERDEDEIARSLRAASPTATPNALVVAHGDDYLGRSGRMREAIERIGRGSFAMEGEPFVIAF